MGADPFGPLSRSDLAIFRPDRSQDRPHWYKIAHRQTTTRTTTITQPARTRASAQTRERAGDRRVDAQHVRARGLRDAPLGHLQSRLREVEVARDAQSAHAVERAKRLAAVVLRGAAPPLGP